MDDILILTPTRWSLRSAVVLVNRVLAGLGLEKHPDKTFIGRIERGFEFLGYAFSREGLTVARTTVEHFVAQATQRYAQEPGTPQGDARLRGYVRRWLGWVRGGLSPAPPVVWRSSVRSVAARARPAGPPAPSQTA